jgi:hypothetical protein
MNSREAFRKTMQLSNPGRPVFVPIVYRLAARIEQVPLLDMVSDPTAYTNVLDGAFKLLGQDGIITNFDPTLEAEFFGCPVDFPGDYDLPVADWSGGDIAAANIESSGRLPVMLEAVKRLVQTRGREVAIIGAITGPCSLDANIGGVVDTAVPAVGELLTKLTKAICEAKIDGLIIREDLLAGKLNAEFLAREKAYAAAYATLLNLTRFYNVAGLLMVKGQKLDEMSALAKKLAPAGLILSGQKLSQADLTYLKDLSVSQKLAIGLPLPLEEPEGLAEQFNLYEDFINKHKPGGFFYTSDGEVPPEISLEGLHEISSRIKGVQVSWGTGNKD